MEEVLTPGSHPSTFLSKVCAVLKPLWEDVKKHRDIAIGYNYNYKLRLDTQWTDTWLPELSSYCSEREGRFGKRIMQEERLVDPHCLQELSLNKMF